MRPCPNSVKEPLQHNFVSNGTVVTFRFNSKMNYSKEGAGLDISCDRGRGSQGEHVAPMVMQTTSSSI